MRRRAAILIGFCLFSVTGCSGVKDYLGSYVDMFKEQSLSNTYKNRLKQWTREQTAYSELETRFQISATYRSQAFREAFLKEQARVFILSPEEQKRREAQQRETASEFTEFFFYAYTADKVQNDFGERNSLWRVFIVDEAGRQIDPLEIRKVEKVSPMVETLFPYVQKYYGFCYNIKFPRQSASSLKLVFTSYLGKVELLWNS